MASSWCFNRPVLKGEPVTVFLGLFLARFFSTRAKGEAKNT